MPLISTHALFAMPAIDQLKRLSQSLALLDAILWPTWGSRYYSCDAHWSDGEVLASMRNGGGDAYCILFTPAGAILKGFAHTAPMTPFRVHPPRIWPGVLDAVPRMFAAFLTEPAFVIEETTFCMWRTSHDTTWQRGRIDFPDHADPDGSQELLTILDGNPQTYHVYAEMNAGRPIDRAAVVAIYRHQPLTDATLFALNPAVSRAAITANCEEIGYPG